VFINKLKITNFRILQEKEFNFTKNINVFHGDNGTGKTSILESIHYLSTGKSFRKCSFKSLINVDFNYLNVFVELVNDGFKNTVSINKSKSGLWKARFNNSTITKQSQISNLVPVVSIDPEVYRLVDLGPINRRNFLDWLVFHVKHDYLILWKKVQKCSKQLNSLYKSKANTKEIDLWENSFIEFSEQLNEVRELFYKQIKPIILSLTKHMQSDISDLDIEYYKGWSERLTLKEQLIKDRKRNLLYGQLQHGPHKMDIKIHVLCNPASQVLSRGQKKVLSLSFYMAYIKLLQNHDVKPIVCLDDLDAELDDNKLSKVGEFFIQTNLQLFITTVLSNKIKKTFPNAQMFHVKH
jgi:DNA replication and repair protein RecF